MRLRLRVLEDKIMDWLATLLRHGTQPLLVLLPLLSCCWLSGIAGQLIPGLRSVYVNHLDRVDGVVELVAPSQWRPIIYGMAPDGGRILMSWQQRFVREWLIFNTATQQTTPLALTDIVTAIWLDDRYVVVYGKFPGMYALIDATTGQDYPIAHAPAAQYQHPGGLAVVEPILRADPPAYLLGVFGENAAYKILHLRGTQGVLFDISTREFNLTPDALLAWLHSLPLEDRSQLGIVVPKPQTYPVQVWAHRERVAARYGSAYVPYMLLGITERSWISLLRPQTGEVLAEVEKWGWQADIVGWDASDTWLYSFVARQAPTPTPRSRSFDCGPSPPPRRWPRSAGNAPSGSAWACSAPGCSSP